MSRTVLKNLTVSIGVAAILTCMNISLLAFSNDLPSWAKYYEQQQYDQAIGELNKGLEQVTDTERRADLLADLGVVYRAKGDSEQAISNFKRAIELYESVNPADKFPYAMAINNLAQLYTSQSKFEIAEPLLQKDLTLLSPESPGYETVLYNTGLLYRDWGKYDKAEPYFLQSIAKAKKDNDPAKSILLESEYGLALLYAKQGQLDKSEATLEEAINYAKNSLGPEHPHTRELEQVLAQVKSLKTKAENGPSTAWKNYMDQGVNQLNAKQFAEAEINFTKAMQEVENAAPNSLAMGITLMNLGVSYLSQGKFDKAEPTLKRAIAINTEHLGPNDESVKTMQEALRKIEAKKQQ